MSTSCYWATCLGATAALVGAIPVRAELTVEAGLAPYQVIQCDDAGVATLVCSGRHGGAAKVQTRITRDGSTIRDWQDGRVDEHAWNAAIEGVPAGGPYRFEVRALDANHATTAAMVIDHVLVGDLWILAGQSNMQGCGNLVDLEPPSSQVNVFAMNDTWRNAVEPLHRLDESADIIHSGVEDDAVRRSLVSDTSTWTKGSGLGLTFAKELVHKTGRPIGLVPCAHGGTTMAEWNPALRDQGGLSLYGAMYRRFKEVGGKVRGALWYQGESDTMTLEATEAFPQNFKGFVEALRKDFGAPELPFYYVQIGRFTNPDDPTNWNRVQEFQRLAETDIPHAAMVASIDLELDDLIHIGTDGLKVLGRRMAALAAHDLFGAGDLQPGPRLAGVCRAGTPYGPQIVVTFTGVNGLLRAEGRVSGFSISDASGKTQPYIYHQEINPDDPASVILWVNEVPAGARLWYGRGFDPYCNLVDEAGMALPVFGPVSIPD